MNHIEHQLNRVKNLFESDKSKQLPISTIEQQLSLFVNGVKIPQLARPCTIGDGIIKLLENDHNDLLCLCNSASSKGRQIKFVPASGAASRMFQKLQSVLIRFNNLTLAKLKEYSKNDSESKFVLEFLLNLPKFAFYDDLKMVLNADDIQIRKLVSELPEKIINAVLFEWGLNYLSKPKGAIKFHRYKNECRTAFEEQIYEALSYLVDINNKVRIHFTISEEHKDLFVEIADKIKLDMKYDYNLEITFSYQKKSTDTIAVNENNELLFDSNGNLVLRPGGHGALLENLNDLKADVVIIKNIDNLSTANLSSDTDLYKKLLIGYLIKIQKQIFSLLDSLDRKDFSENKFNEMVEFAEKDLFLVKPNNFKNWSEEQRHKFLFDYLNRPIRICGMVKNEGEPGGSPFWVKSDDGNDTLQIVEPAQINSNDEIQKNIFKQSTHFNPVDLVCGVKDYKGNNFDLHDFVDHQSAIVTKKSKDGIEIKALELPGLWNGSMADWITIFVEVPVSTFNPVKEVNDLLRKEHQN